jgi:hypothetical protein|tara:strand:- start:4216 stop:4899 length:684 start_codon:yes stop_codon:yes gene_type:complete
MAHFAEIKESNNEVVRVLVFSNEDINSRGGDLSAEAEAWVATTPSSIEENVYWKQTSYNHNFRKQYAGKTMTYDLSNDVFILPAPDYSSWSLNANHDWVPPVEMITMKTHPTWVQQGRFARDVAQKTWVPPIASPSETSTEVNGQQLGYDVRWDANREMFIGKREDNTWWDWNGTAWITSSVSEFPTSGSYYEYTWHEDTQKWTAVNANDDNLNYEWNVSTQTWDEV